MQTMPPRFHPLQIAAVRQETEDAVSITLQVPEELRDLYRPQPGQFLSLRAWLDGQEHRRAYSLCGGMHDYQERGWLQIGIKQVAGGAFSSWAQHLQAGQEIEAQPPDGRFTLQFDTGQRKHYVAFAAGSGITPILSLIKTGLDAEPHSRFTLVYGNRDAGSIMFAEALQDLKDLYLSRFSLHHVLSRSPNEIALHHGRIDSGSLPQWLALLPATEMDQVLLCGPHGMMEDVQQGLLAAGLPPQRILCERFNAPPATVPTKTETIAAFDGTSIPLTVQLDGKRHHLRLPRQGASILEVALAAGLDLPYACRAGVCCTCRAKLISGQVAMEKNYTLEDWELAQGFVLTCQAHPLSEEVCVSFDER
jgi:ring-1,2-phenylacetyl-CoA epoxidase subunit PaaE